MKQLTRLVAVVVDTTKAVFYKADGTTLEILQGDARLRPLLEKITPLISSWGYADVDLSTENSWKEFEEKSTGGFRFFKIAKEKLKNFFHGDPKEPVPPLVSGVLPSAKVAVEKTMSVVDEIIANATPVRAPEFSEEGIAPQRPTVEAGGVTPSDRVNNGTEEHFDKHKETIVAVSPDGKVIPGVERVKSQFTAAAKTGNTKGMEAFMHRIGKVLQKRRHTVEDLLRFMERGDMPVADDGSIIIFKKLYKSGDHFVDPHTRKVKQKVGSLVYMDESLVDPNRRNECSNGLHVARRGYIQSFSGDTIMLAKVRPEDVIAVPDYDANKMRVCAYHIIAELTPLQYRAINSNRPISDAEGGAELLGNAIAGNHVGILERVRIGAAMGEGLEVVPEKEAPKSKRAKRKVKRAIAKKAKAVKPTKALESDTALKADKPVDVKQVAAKAKDSKVSLTKTEAPKPLSQKDEVQAMWDEALKGNKKKAQELLDFKKAAKKGWSVWGLDPSAGDTLKALIGN